MINCSFIATYLTSVIYHVTYIKSVCTDAFNLEQEDPFIEMHGKIEAQIFNLSPCIQN